MIQLIILSLIILTILTIINIFTTVTNLRQKRAFDDLMMKFISQNQHYYESQKGIIKNQTKHIDLAQKHIKNISSLKTDFKRLFVEMVDKLNESKDKKPDGVITKETQESKVERLKPMIQRLQSNITRMQEDRSSKRKER